MKYKKLYKQLKEKYNKLITKYHYVIEQKSRIEKELDQRNKEYEALWNEKR